MSFLQLLFTLVLLTAKHIQGLQDSDAKVTVVTGATAILPCGLGGTTDLLSQITWQRTIPSKPRKDVFLTVQLSGSKFNNGKDERFEFIGSLPNLNGTLRLYQAALGDEGTYECIFSLFPSGNHVKDIQLVVLAPPITNSTSSVFNEGTEEVPLATCTAAVSKPPAEVKWITGALEGAVREELTNTSHPNGTTSTRSTLLGRPERRLNGAVVKCIITNKALGEEDTLEEVIQVQFAPAEVRITERDKVSFECESEANPNAAITWSRINHTTLPSRVRAEGSTLQFLSKASELSGVYECKAENAHGTKTSQIFVHFSTETCITGWILFGVILSLNIIVGLFAYHHGKLPRFTACKKTDSQDREAAL